MKYKSGYPLACEYLGRVKESERTVERMKERVLNLRMLLTDTSVHLSDMPHSDSPDLQKHETLHAEIDELEREIAAAEKSKQEIRAEISVLLTRLQDPLGQRALILYYMENKRWTAVAEKMGFSIAQTYRFRDAGLAELEELLKAAA